MAASMVTSPPQLVVALGDSRGPGQQALFVLQPAKARAQAQPALGLTGHAWQVPCLRRQARHLNKSWRPGLTLTLPVPAECGGKGGKTPAEMGVKLSGSAICDQN